MERPMDSWNDERLDEMSRRMDEGFKEMREGFARIEQQSNERFERLYLVMITAAVGVIASVLLG